MIKRIVSKRVEIPPIFLIENEEDFKTLPAGIPYIIGNQSELAFVTIFLEFQILYRSCMKTGIPVKWLDCLKKIGYNPNNIRDYTLQSGGQYNAASSSGKYTLEIDNFIEDQYFVDFDKLSDLRILPKWLDDIKESIQTNIIDEVTFNPMAFNKQLGMHIGYGDVKHNMKNLLILDISASMPKSVVLSITNLAKLMSKKFYADVILTGRQSILIDYDDVPNSDIIALTKQMGGGNEGVMFNAITSEPKEYNTVISFGDDDSPGNYTDNGKCRFTVETLYSLHTEKSSINVTGYSKCLKPNTTHIVKDWLNTIEGK